MEHTPGLLSATVVRLSRLLSRLSATVVRQSHHCIHVQLAQLPIGQSARPIFGFFARGAMALTVLSDQDVNNLLESLTADEAEALALSLKSTLHEYSTGTQGPVAFHQPERTDRSDIRWYLEVKALVYLLEDPTALRYTALRGVAVRLPHRLQNQVLPRPLRPSLKAFLLLLSDLAVGHSVDN